jgi:hypothetical protein
MLKTIFALAICLLMVLNAEGQSDKIGYGFRAGPSYSKIKGPSEVDPDGKSLEEFTNTRGFHIGVSFSYKLADQMGFRGELLFSQRGTKYSYNGPSYYLLGRNSPTSITLSGTRHQPVKVSNAFLDIPVLYYYKLGKLELVAGINTGFLIASTGSGVTTFEGISPFGSAVEPFDVTLDANYKKDKAGEGSSEIQIIYVDGFPYAGPTTIGAYYDFPVKNENLYKSLDFGLVFGAAFYISEGLSVGVRYVLGLGDADVNDYDVSLQSLNPDGSFIYRTDNNKSESLQFSVGFSF